MKSSQQRKEIGFESEKKRLISFHPKENDTLSFDQGENRGNVEVSRGSERKRCRVGDNRGEKSQKEKEKASGRHCYQGSNMAGCDMWSTGRGNQTDID